MFYSYHSTNTAFFRDIQFIVLFFLFLTFFFCVWKTKCISYALVIFHKLGQQLNMKSVFVMYVSKILSPL